MGRNDFELGICHRFYKNRYRGDSFLFHEFFSVIRTSENCSSLISTFKIYKDGSCSADIREYQDFVYDKKLHEQITREEYETALDYLSKQMGRSTSQLIDSQNMGFPKKK